MKRLLTLITAALLLFSFAACTEDNPVANSSVAVVSSQATSKIEQKEFALGTITGNKYESEFLGLGAELGANWTVYTKEQIMELNNIIVDTMNDEDIKEILSNADVVYDLYAMNMQDGQSVNIVLEPVDKLTALVTTEEQYISNALSGNIFESALEGMGYSNIQAEESTATFLSKERKSIRITAEINGVAFYEELVVIKQGNYFAVITVSSLLDDMTADLFSQFYSL